MPVFPLIARFQTFVSEPGETDRIVWSVRGLRVDGSWWGTFRCFPDGPLGGIDGRLDPDIIEEIANWLDGLPDSLPGDSVRQSEEDTTAMPDLRFRSLLGRGNVSEFRELYVGVIEEERSPAGAAAALQIIIDHIGRTPIATY